MFGQYNSSFLLIRIYCFCLDIVFSIIKKLLGEKIDGTANGGHKILVSNVAHLGDVLYSLRVVALLKEKYPSADIDFLCGSWSLPLVKSCSDINNVYVVDHWKLNRKNMCIVKKLFISFYTWIKALIAIKRQHYDVGIDFFLMYPSMSDIFYFADIKKRIGYTSGGGGVLFTDKIYFTDPGRHIIELNAECVRLLGVDTSSLGYSVANVVSDKKTSNILEHFGLARKNFYVFHYGAGEPEKEWSTERWVALLDSLNNENTVVVMTGAGAREYAAIDYIVSHTKNKKVLSLCDALSISELFMIIKNAQLFVGCDSFAGHIAGMYKINQVSIMHGATKQVVWQPYSNSNCFVLRANVDCLECQAPRKCKYNHKCMNIEVEAVYNVIVNMDK